MITRKIKSENERSYFKRASPAVRPSELNFFGSSDDNDIIFGVERLWGMKNIFRIFGQQLLTKFWYWMSNMSKSPQKCEKRQLLTKNQGIFCSILFTAMIFGWEVAQGVYNNLRKQLQSYLWFPGKYWLQRFCHFHQF